MDTVSHDAQVAPAGSVAPYSETGQQVFVDASGRRARRMTRCGYVLGVSCLGYIGMVALGLSGTRVAALPGVPTRAENEIIAGLSGEGGAIGLHLTRSPVVATRPAPSLATRAVPARATEMHAADMHAAAVRSAAAHSATLSARAALARSRQPGIAPSAQAGALTAYPQNSAYPQTAYPQTGDEQVLAEGGTPADAADPTESKSQEKAEAKAEEKSQQKASEKEEAKHSKHDSEDESY